MNSLPTSMKTNLPVEEMIPETGNPAHDSRYWCLPPVREDLDAAPNASGKPMQLVTQGFRVGIYRHA